MSDLNQKQESYLRSRIARLKNSIALGPALTRRVMPFKIEYIIKEEGKSKRILEEGNITFTVSQDKIIIVLPESEVSGLWEITITEDEFKKVCSGAEGGEFEEKEEGDMIFAVSWDKVVIIMPESEDYEKCEVTIRTDDFKKVCEDVGLKLEEEEDIEEEEEEEFWRV